MEGQRDGMMEGQKDGVMEGWDGGGQKDGMMEGQKDGVMEGQRDGAMVSGFFSSTFRDAAAFAILILILLYKPAGILGKNVREKV